MTINLLEEDRKLSYDKTLLNRGSFSAIALPNALEHVRVSAEWSSPGCRITAPGDLVRESTDVFGRFPSMTQHLEMACNAIA